MKTFTIILKWIATVFLIAAGSSCIDILTNNEPMDNTTTGLLIIIMICAYSSAVCFIADIIGDIRNSKK